MREALLLALLVLAMSRKKPGIADLPFVDVDGTLFDVDPDQDTQLAELEPVTRRLVAQLLREARAEGLNVRIVERTGAKRSKEEQLREFNEGDSKTKDGPHVYGAAVDLRFIDPEPWSSKHPWARLGAIGKRIGLGWGGDWKSLKDLGHFERRDWRALRAVS